MTTQTKLDRFIALFKNEAELREAVLALLEKMPNVKNARHTHGAQELGKDIVFNWLGPFDRQQLVACVIKNDRITGSAESNHGARTVYSQAEEAFDSPVANVATGIDERVTQVFVISPHECPPATVESIKGKMQARAGQVVFICGRELMERFEEHYPEFLLFNAGLYGSYITELEQGLDADPAVMNVLFRHGFISGPKKLTALYVRPKFSRDLHRFKMRVTPPETKDLLSLLTLEESDLVQKWFAEVGRLVTAITAPDDTGTVLQASFGKLAQEVKSGWRDGYEAHRRQPGISIEDRTRPRNEVRVNLNDADRLSAAAADLLQSANVHIARFKEKMIAANRCSESEFASAQVMLRSPLLLDYCQVEGVSTQVPWLVQMDVAPSQEWVLDEEVIDSTASDLLITGPAGFGKTSFCKWQTLHDLKRYREDDSQIIPVYVPLHQLAQGELGSFETTFLRAPEIIALWQRNAVSPHPKSPRFRLYLDGLDEVPSLTRQKSLLALAEKGKKADSRTSIIVTGRDHVAGTHLARFVRVGVREFDDDQIKDLAVKWFENDEHSIAEFFNQVEKVPTLLPLMGVPLLATLVFGVYKNTKTLPESRAKLYDMFVSLLAGGWDVAKNVHRQTEFGPAPKLTVLTKLAAMLHMGQRRDCSQADFRTAVKTTLPALREKSQKLLEETIQDGLLVPTGLTFAFAHLSFQEYLAAKSLFEPNSGKAAQVFGSFLNGDDWWREVVTFYIALSTDPSDVEHFIHRIAERVRSKTARDVVRNRAYFLLETLAMCFPGAEPNFRV